MDKLRWHDAYLELVRVFFIFVMMMIYRSGEGAGQFRKGEGTVQEITMQAIVTLDAEIA